MTVEVIGYGATGVVVAVVAATGVEEVHAPDQADVVETVTVIAEVSSVEVSTDE